MHKQAKYSNPSKLYMHVSQTMCAFAPPTPKPKVELHIHEDLYHREKINAILISDKNFIELSFSATLLLPPFIVVSPVWGVSTVVCHN